MGRINLGIGLATGRKSFKKVVNAYINGWNETKKDLPHDMDVHPSLFVSYDLDYQNAKSTDFTNLKQETVDAFDRVVFIGAKNASRELEKIQKQSAFSSGEIKSVFGSGYAGKRNAVLFSAIEYQMDYLLFLDDDEYPMAVTNNKNSCLWSGQQVFLTHLAEIANADYTNGYHCGYISPIPQLSFGKGFSAEDFRLFIEAISNDIINWDNIKRLMNTGGVTYASIDVLTQPKAVEVPLKNGCRFISGANLCINLKDPQRSFPFYNPPGARGEDTFLSTMLNERKVLKVPCYTFHDGFSLYNHMLEGVLPIHLSAITEKSAQVMTRFINACIGWIRYKPLLTYITQHEKYEASMQKINDALNKTVPLLSEHFDDNRFMAILTEFDKYRKNVKRHYSSYQLAQSTWKKVIEHIV